MLNKKSLVLLLLVFSLTLIIAQEIELSNRYSYNLYPYTPSVNVTLNATINNSIYWDGNAFDPLRWLNIDGSNANQDVDVRPYDVIADAFIGDGSGLTNLPIVNIFDQNLNTTENVSFVEVKGQVGNFTDLYVSNSTLFIGNISMSSFNDTIFVEENKSLFADFLIGDGSQIYNLDLTNVTIEGGNITAVNFNGSNFYGGDFQGGTFNGSTFIGGNVSGVFSGIYDWTAELPYLIFNGTFLQFNETYLNQTIDDRLGDINITDINVSSITLSGETITDWSQVNYTVGNNSVFFQTPSVSGTYSTVLPETFNFEIAQIIIEPLNPTRYRFGMYESPSGQTIDANLRRHFGEWNIFKSYPIDSQVSLNFTAVAGTNEFNVTIKYFENQPN